MSYTLALGRPDLYPEIPVLLSGFKPEIDDAQWLAKTVTHKIDSSGFTTALDLESTAMRRQIGIARISARAGDKLIFSCANLYYAYN